jgi:lysophospholipase
MRLEMQVIKAKDGTELFVRSYSPEGPHVERTLFWVHGLGEHGGRHEHVAQVVAHHGWRMIIPDLRGHGKSSGVRTHVLSFDEYVDDMVQIWKELKLHDASTTLLGHSMGGLVAVRIVQSGRVAPSALVISSPLLGLKLHINPVSVLLGRLLVPFISTVRFSNGIDPGNMTHDSEFAAMRRQDPLIDKTVTAGWFFAMRKALAAGRRKASGIKLPVFAMQGSRDETTDPDALSEWWDRIQSTDKTLVILEDHFHELFFESDWNETTLQTLDWMGRRNPMRSRALHSEEDQSIRT